MSSRACLFITIASLMIFQSSRAQKENDSKIYGQAMGQLISQLDSLAILNSQEQFSGVLLIGKLDKSQMGKPPLFLKAYGHADLQNNISNTPDTRFITASIAQTFVAVAILQLAESGKIELHEPLSRYLADTIYSHRIGDHITVSQLLSHTAGLGNFIKSPAFRRTAKDFHQLSQLVALVRDEPQDPPGKFLYGNSDNVLLGAIIEQVSGIPFEEYMRVRLFLPANMIHTGYDMSHPIPDLAHGYTASNLGDSRLGWPVRNPSGDTMALLYPNDRILPATGVPGAVAYTTATDLMLFAQELQNDRILRNTSKKDLWGGKISTGQEGPNREYAYGFFVGENGNCLIINHGGTGPGIDNGFDIYPDLGYVVVVLCNYDQPAGQKIRQFIRDKMAGFNEHPKQ